jgi:hypothetical protein
MELAKSTTPLVVSKEIARLCKTICKTTKPVFVPVQSATVFKAHYCFDNVKKHVAQHGGRVQYGWTIWELPKLLIEGEFHAVWNSPEGQLIDVTEKPDGEEKILFLPDDSREFKGTLIDNIRQPLVDNVVTRRIVDRGRAMDALKSKYHNDEIGECKIPQGELFALERRFLIR